MGVQEIAGGLLSVLLIGFLVTMVAKLIFALLDI